MFVSALAMDRAPASVALDAMAFDKSARTYDADGHLHVASTNISKANVCPYFGHEIPDFETLGLDPDRKYQLLRDPEELKKAAPTFNNLKLLSEHVPISAEDPRPELVIGSTGTDAAFDGTYMQNSLVVWPQDYIDAIESGKQKELSSAYRYRADMTPGEFKGVKFDGVMRDIVGNHVALVPEGRAGADVVVGDSKPPNGEIQMSKIVLTRKAAMAGGAISAYLAPKLAKDSKFDIATVLNGVTSKNFKAKRPDIIAGIQKAKLAQDDTIDVKDLGKILDMVEASEVEEGADADPNSGLPLSAEEMEKQKKSAKDAEPMNKAKNFFKDKLNAEDWKSFDDMMGTVSDPEAMDETTEEKAAREKKEGEDAAARDAAGETDKDDEPKVTKKAMDAAIAVAVRTAAKTATDAALKTANEIATAREVASLYVGKLAMDATCAADVFKGALDVLGKDVKGVHPSAYRTILELQPKLSDKSKPRIASDSAPDATGFNGRWGKTVERIGGAA